MGYFVAIRKGQAGCLHTGWAYARAYRLETERQACCQDFIEHYNHHRPHTALKGALPISRVTYVPG
jgi:transposase InsO family protein